MTKKTAKFINDRRQERYIARKAAEQTGRPLDTGDLPPTGCEQPDKATHIFDMIKTAAKLHNVELRLAAIQDALVHYEAEHAALVAVAEAAKKVSALLHDMTTEHFRTGYDKVEREALDQALAALASVRQ